MKQATTLSVLFLITCFLFISCQKSEMESPVPDSIFSSAKNREAIGKAIANYYRENHANAADSRDASNGASFIAPFFIGENFSIGNFNWDNFSLELASFTAELKKGDFYRKNPDGTISVHVNSNTSLAEYFQNLFDPGALYLFGSRAHLSANYTGNLVEWPIYDENGNLMFVIKFIDLSASGRAVSFHGNGNVGPEGKAPWKKLSAKAVTTPGSQALVEFKLN